MFGLGWWLWAGSSCRPKSARSRAGRVAGSYTAGRLMSRSSPPTRPEAAGDGQAREAGTAWEASSRGSSYRQTCHGWSSGVPGESRDDGSSCVGILYHRSAVGHLRFVRAPACRRSGLASASALSGPGMGRAIGSLSSPGEGGGRAASGFDMQARGGRLETSGEVMGSKLV